MADQRGPNYLKELQVINYKDLQSETFDKIISSLPFPFIVIDLNYRIVKTNGAANKLYRGGREKIKFCYELRCNLDLPCRGENLRCPLEMVRDSGKTAIVEQRYLIEDGTFVPMEICAVPVVNREGEVILVAEMVFDISERKQANELIKRYEVMSENARDIIIVLSLDGHVLEVNEAAVKGYGYTREELLGLTIFDLRVSETNNEVIAQMKQAKDEGILFEALHRRKDGVLFPVEVSSQGVVLGDERVIFSIIRDIAERKQVEEKLRSAHQQVKDIVEFLPDATFVIDRDKKVIAWNRAMEEITGVPKEDILGKGDYAYSIPFYGKRRPVLVDMLWSSFSEEEKHYTNMVKVEDAVFAETFTTLKHNDKGVYLWLKASPLYDATGGIAGAIEAVRDISEFKRIEHNIVWEAEVNATLAELSRALVSSASIDEIANLVLEHGKRLTSSRFGFVGYIDPLTGYLVSPTMTRDVWDVCNVSGKDSVFSKFGGLWGWVLRNRKGLMTNNPGQDPRSSGVPKGHIAIERFLATPALLDDNMVGMVALANSNRDYISRDMELMERLAYVYALAVGRKWDEERMVKINECFLTFGTDPDENINLLTALCGELLGASSAIYNRLDKGMLCSIGQWRTPESYGAKANPEGQICNDLIRRGDGRVMIVRDLQNSLYARTNPDVMAYGLQTYMGHPVKLENKYVGALCVVFQRDVNPSVGDQRLLGIIASAIGVEEERKLAQEKLRQSRSLNLAVLNSLTAHIAVLDGDGNILAVNDSWRQFGWENGATRDVVDALGLNYLEHCRRGVELGCESSKEAFEGIKSVLYGSLAKFNMEYPCHAPGEKRWFLLSVTPLSGESGGAVVSHLPITEQKKSEGRQQAELAILSELANFNNLKQSIGNVLKNLLDVMGCDAAAIRLFNGEDFTYFAHTGFSHAFIEKESSLCCMDKEGNLLRDSNGWPVLECLCGKVIKSELMDRIDNRYLTAYGSFFTGCSSRLKDGENGPLGLEGVWRLTCPAEGYETLVLVPIKEDDKNIGLLQLNSFQANIVNYEDMPFLELISRHISSAIKHLHDAEALRESEERYRRLAENAPDAIYRINLNPRQQRYEYISPVIKQLTGYTPEEHYANPDLAFKIVHPEDRVKFERLTGGVVEAGEPVELRWVRKDGGVVWTEQRNLVIRGRDGDIVALEGIARDVTERKKTEAARQERMMYDRIMADAMTIFTGYHKRETVLKKLLALVAGRLDYSAGAFFNFNEWTRSLQISTTRMGDISLTFPAQLENEPAINDLFTRKSQVIGVDDNNPFILNVYEENYPRSLTTLALPVRYQEIIYGVLILCTSKKPLQNEISFFEQAAVQLGITLNGIKQFDDLKTLSQQLAARHKEIENKNRELEYANKTKSEFLTNMSHELRTPLNSVIGFSELLERELFGNLNKRQLEYVKDIKESGEHLLALINDILDLSKIEAGAMELDLHSVYLPDLLQGCIRMFREKGMKKNIKLELQMDEQVGLITVDSRKIKQVIFNLLSNALKFTTEGGRVILSATVQKEIVTISVADNGIGISEEDSEKIFMEFSQVDGSLSRRHEGTGLGLALSKKLVEMHGGRIWLESKLGVGSSFIFNIPADLNAKIEIPPIVKSHRLPLTGSVESGKNLINSPLVLVVEDNDRDARLLEAYLLEEGYRVVRAVNGERGFEMARKLHPHIITLDILMPLLDGWGMLEKLKSDRELENIPVIIISVATDLEKGVEFGAPEVLIKPVEPEIMIDIIRNKLASYSDQLNPQPTILIIDDDPKAVEIITVSLIDQGYRILGAYGGAEGIRIAREEKVDLILLDLMMPEVNGYHVIKALKQDPKLKDVPVIVLTAKILNKKDYAKLQGLVEAVKEKGAFSRTWLLAEVSKVLGKQVPAKE